MSDAIYPKGMFIKRRPNSPDFVIGKLSVKMEDFIQFANEHENNGWLNFDVKKKKSDGSPYIELDTWKPDGQKQSQPEESFESNYDLPPNDEPF